MRGATNAVFEKRRRMYCELDTYGDRTARRAADHCRKPILQSNGRTVQVCATAPHRVASPGRGAGSRPFRFREEPPQPGMQRRSHRHRPEPDSTQPRLRAGLGKPKPVRHEWRRRLAQRFGKLVLLSSGCQKCPMRSPRLSRRFGRGSKLAPVQALAGSSCCASSCSVWPA
jgi:hypothetical protein